MAKYFFVKNLYPLRHAKIRTTGFKGWMNFIGVTFDKEFINVSRDNEVARGPPLLVGDECNARAWKVLQNHSGMKMSVSLCPGFYGIDHSIFRRRFALDLKRIDYAFHMEDAVELENLCWVSRIKLSPISARFHELFLKSTRKTYLNKGFTYYYYMYKSILLKLDFINFLYSVCIFFLNHNFFYKPGT